MLGYQDGRFEVAWRVALDEVMMKLSADRGKTTCRSAGHSPLPCVREAERTDAAPSRQ